MANGFWRSLLDPVAFVARTFFPNDSPYQRIRRQRIIFCTLIGVPLLVLAVAATIMKFSDSGGLSLTQSKSDPLAKVKMAR